MSKIWKIKIRKSTKREFPNDPMMQELHEIRARLSRKYKPIKMDVLKTKRAIPLEKIKTK